MQEHLPLPALLSQTWVAFTIELDNEFEHRAPHRTSAGGSRGDPWLASVTMWYNCMRFVAEKGITVRDLRRLARMSTNLDGMRRWGYVFIEPAGGKPKLSSVLRATPKGLMTRQVWTPLFGEVESRWRKRFGAAAIEQLRALLATLIGGFDVDLPDSLPILRYGLVTEPPDKQEARSHENISDLPLPALLAKPLLAFAIEFERESKVSLAICANVLRLAPDGSVRLRDLPRMAGVSKEAIAMALSFLTKRGYATEAPESPGSRTKLLTLTPAGRRVRDDYRRLVSEIEQRWHRRFDNVDVLRTALERLAGDLFRGLEPYAEGWRAAVPKPEALPHYPMVLHRGGYPDGS